MLEQSNGLPDDFIDADKLTPLGQFRDWIERPGHLNFWMQYPADPGDLRAMREQIDEVLDHPDEVSPKIIFNVAMKSAEVSRHDGDYMNASLNVLSSYGNGLTALSRCNKFSMQEHGHYWNALTTLLNSQSIFVQRGERKSAARRTQPPGR